MEIETDHYRKLVSVRFPVENVGRKRKGVSRTSDPSRGRREETPDDCIARRKSSTAGIDGTSLAAGGRTGAGDVETSGGGFASSRAGPARGRGPATGRESVPLGLHGAEMLDDAVGEPRAGARSAAARAGRDRASGTLRAARFGPDAVRADGRRAEPAQGGRLGAAVSGRDAVAGNDRSGAGASATAS